MSEISSWKSPASQQVAGDCYLLDLPADVRNLIYDLVFGFPEGVHLDFNHNDREPIWKTTFALSSTCRQIYFECKDLPYWLNTFHFHVPILDEPKQLVGQIRPYHISAPVVLPLPQAIQSQYFKRHIASAPGKLSSEHQKVREKAQQYITMAMRLPHIDEMVSRLERTAMHPVIDRIRNVHIHLGSQVRHPFIERFFTAWGQVAPALSIISARTNVRVSFELRISKRLSVAYGFGIQNADQTLSEMDACVEAEEFTLSELAILNGVRVRVWGAFFGTEDAKTPAPFRPEYGLDSVCGTYRSCGVAVVDRAAFGRNVELKA